jgi:uncharacterized membrane protein
LAPASALDISDTGIVAGFSPQGAQLTFAVRWDAGSTTATALPGVYPNATGPVTSLGYAVNNAGTVVGTSYAPSGTTGSVGRRATRWAAGGSIGASLDPVYTGTSAGTFDNTATDINNGGTTIGYAGIGGLSPYTGVRWAADSSVATLLQGFGTDANDRSISQPRDLNNAGTTVGTARKFDASHTDLGAVAVRWDADSATPVELPILPGGTASGANAINDAGVIVGSVFTPQPVGSRAVAWMPDGRVINLTNLLDPGSGYILTNALSISEDNWISGSSLFDPDGPGGVNPSIHNFLIQLPEPASIASLGLVAVVLRRRGR